MSLIKITSDDSRDFNRSIGFAKQILFNKGTGNISYADIYCYKSNVNYFIKRNKIKDDGPPLVSVKISHTNGLYMYYYFKSDTNSNRTKIINVNDYDIVNLISYQKKLHENITGRQVSCDIMLNFSSVKNVFESAARNDSIDLVIAKASNYSSRLVPLLKEIPAVQDKIFKIIKKHSCIPFLKEWLPKVLKDTAAIKIIPHEAYYADINDPDNLYIFNIQFSTYTLEKTVRDLLSQGLLNINGTNAPSPLFAEHKITNLTEYLEHFSGILISKATNKFIPTFNPNTDQFNKKELSYFEYANDLGKLNLFNSQKNVMTAVSRSLNKEKSALIVGEMGCGKTSISIGSVFLNSKKKNPTNIVMCPGHLVEKWKREIERLYPGAFVKIISDFNTLLRLDERIRNKERKYPLFLVISKDVAKISYTERPNVIYDKNTQNFKCPHCGKTLINKNSIIIMGRQYDDLHIKDKRCSSKKVYVRNIKSIEDRITLFASKKRTNKVCTTSTYLVSNKELNIIKYKKGLFGYANASCGCCLWSATNSKEVSSWKKYPGFGFIHDDMVQEIKEEYQNQVNKNWEKTSQEKKTVLTKAYKAILTVEEYGENKKAPRRYSIAKYIRKKYKGLIDYFIADEVHMYSSSSSAQADAFGDFVRTAKKTIALTGTLLNGYANGIYYILYRMYSRSFKEAGYGYLDSLKFVHDFGVDQEIEKAFFNGNRYVKTTRTTKTCPGVSPELFTKFLFDKAIFVSLADMSTGLPSYTETPIGIYLEPDVRKKYNDITNSIRSYFSYSRDHGQKLLVSFTAAQKLSLYPDQPYNMAPIVNPNNYSETLIDFPDAIPKDVQQKYVSAKDLKILEIVNEKVQKGENVLIYLDYVNKTDCIERLERMFKVADIKACTLTAAIAAKSREEWIDTKVREGYKVMICNPRLVETGLDLLSFTNIIFYQVGYNLFTMRQASRRSLRLNQPNPVNVYFMYYKNTAQEVILSLMANKLQAAMAIEGKFTEEGLVSMSNNDNILTRLANSLIEDIEYKIEEGTFQSSLKAEDDDGSRFKMVYILDKNEKNQYRSIFFNKKHKIKLFKEQIFEAQIC